MKEIGQRNAEPEEKVKTSEKADTSSKQQLLKYNPWLAEVNKAMIYSDFNAYANMKRKEGLNFDTSDKWKIFKKFNDR